MAQVLSTLAAALVSAGVASQAAPAAPAAAPAAPAAPTFDSAAIKSAAVALSAADKSFEFAVKQTAQAVSRVIGTAPTLALWDAVKAAFVADYTTARGCTEKTADNRWSAIAAAMLAEFALEKPRAVTPAAVAKSAQRETASAAVDRVIAQHGSVQALLEAAKSTPKAELATMAKAIEKAATTEKRAADEKLRETLKTERDTVRDRVGKCTDVAALTLAAQVFLMDADMVAAVSAELGMIAKRVEAARAKAAKAAQAKAAKPAPAVKETATT